MVILAAVPSRWRRAFWRAAPAAASLLFRCAQAAPARFLFTRKTRV